VTPLEAPDVAIDAAGNAIAVWKLEGSNDIVQAAMRPRVAAGRNQTTSRKRVKTRWNRRWR
jgi:hypothetical protein